MNLHAERHRNESVAWLRAAVLGANDGIVSTAGLVIGVAAAEASRGNIMLAGFAGLVAGAMAMAAGEYVSVFSQADSEKADLAREKAELESDWDHEVKELTDIYIARGLGEGLANQVAVQLMAKDALGVHAREELGITEHTNTNPIQAALASAASFAVGAAMPLVVSYFAPINYLVLLVAVSTIFFLAILGGVAANIGGATVWKGALRVMFWGAFAMLVTFLVGKLFGVSVA